MPSAVPGKPQGSLVSPPEKRVTWAKTHRIVRSIFPPIDLFEDIADPEEWDSLARVAGETNPRLNEMVERVDYIPAERRVGGLGSTWVMAPFAYSSPDRPSRFSDGSYGVYYAGNTIDVALFETIYHHERFMCRTQEALGWTSSFRELVGEIDTELHDLHDKHWVDCLDPDNYKRPQEVAKKLRAAGSNGVAYPSVRHLGGKCIAAFWPDIVSIPKQGRHYSYHWDGRAVDLVRNETEGKTFKVRS